MSIKKSFCKYIEVFNYFSLGRVYLGRAFILVTFFLSVVAFGQENERFSTVDLQQIVDNLVKYNPTIEEARLMWEISKSDEGVVRGEFHPDFVTRYVHSDTSRKTNSQELSQLNVPIFLEERAGFEMALEGRLRTGADYRFGYSMDKINNNINPSNSIFSSTPDESRIDEYQSYFGLSFTQPLLRGAWSGAPGRNVDLAKYEVEIAFHTYRKNLLETLYEAKLAYWNLVHAQGIYEHSSKSVELAEVLYEDHEARFSVGKSSEVELIEARSGLSLRRSELASDQRRVLSATRQLKTLLYPEGDFFSNKLLRAVDTLDVDASQNSEDEYVYEDILTIALLTFPNFRIQQEELDKERARLKMQKNLSLPEVNLIGRYGRSGLSNERLVARNELDDKDYDDWSVGLELRIPLGGVKPKNELAISNLRVEQAEKRLRIIRNEIIRSTETYLNDLETVKDNISYLSDVVTGQEKLVEAELQKLEAGKSDIRRVYEIENELAESRKSEANGLLAYRQIKMQLEYLTALILSDVGFERVQGDELVILTEYEH